MTVSSEILALTDSETLDDVIQCLVENFSIDTQGVCDQQTLFEILIKAASSGDSIENTAKLLKNIPTANDIRYHLKKINNFEELEKRINQALKSRIPLGLKKGCLKIAIDLNLICYYGHPTVLGITLHISKSSQIWYLFILRLCNFICYYQK